MRVALAIAPWSHDETYPPSLGRSSLVSGKFGMLGGATPPLSLLYLAPSLRQAGHEPTFVDGFFVKGEAFERRVFSSGPGLVGFWCTQLSWDRTRRVAPSLRCARLGLGRSTMAQAHRRRVEDNLRPGSAAREWRRWRSTEDPLASPC